MAVMAHIHMYIYIHTHIHTHIKTSSSESRPRKVELMRRHKKRDDYRDYFTHNNGACKHPYKTNLTALIYSLVNGLYKITKSIKKFILDVEPFVVSNDYIIPTPMYRSVIFFYASSFRHSMDSTEMPWSIFSLKFTIKSKTSFNTSMLFALPAAQVLA